MNVVTKSGTNEIHGTAHFYFKNDGLSSAPKRADGTSRRQVRLQPAAGRLHPRRPPAEGQALLLPGLRLPGRPAPPSRPTPRASSSGWWTSSRAWAAPNENGPIERTNDARVFLGKLDWQASAEPPADPALQLHLVRAAERDLRRGLLGPQRQRGGGATTRTRSRGSADLQPLRHRPQRVPLPVGPGVPAAALQRPEHHRPEPAAARHRLRLRRAATGSACPSSSPSTTTTSASSSTTTSRSSRAATRSSSGWSSTACNSVQTFLGFANGRYIFSSTDGFLNYARNPRYVECSNGTHLADRHLPGGRQHHRARCSSSCSRRAWAALSAEEAGTQDIPQTELARLRRRTSGSPPATSPSSTACAGRCRSRPT